MSDQRSRMGDAGPAASPVELFGPTRVGSGYRDYDRYSVRLGDGTETSAVFERDVMSCGRVVGVLAVDPQRTEVVLTRQFRLGAYLATGESQTLEIVAGRVDPGEAAEAAARRECLEEIGVEAKRIVPLMGLSPAPAWSDEYMTLFLANVDAQKAPLHAGNLREQEAIAVARYTIADAIGLLAEGAVHSAPTVIALQWLRLNRESIATLLEPVPA
ncbi:MAG: NUDIX hydrolase [Acidobacteriaceae bacterium]|nr:NUDIX hydrolase [Acidobacteriaceae bacterium]